MHFLPRLQVTGFEHHLHHFHPSQPGLKLQQPKVDDWVVQRVRTGENCGIASVRWNATRYRRKRISIDAASMIRVSQKLSVPFVEALLDEPSAFTQSLHEINVRKRRPRLLSCYDAPPPSPPPLVRLFAEILYWSPLDFLCRVPIPSSNRHSSTYT